TVAADLEKARRETSEYNRSRRTSWLSTAYAAESMIVIAIQTEMATCPSANFAPFHAATCNTTPASNDAAKEAMRAFHTSARMSSRLSGSMAADSKRRVALGAIMAATASTNERYPNSVGL